MKKLTFNEKLFFEIYTSLIECKNECELRHSKEFNLFYMISNTTGIHQLNEPEYNERIKAHWNGFLNNQ
jgi:hypothetical protein